MKLQPKALESIGNYGNIFLQTLGKDPNLHYSSPFNTTTLSPPFLILSEHTISILFAVEILLSSKSCFLNLQFV